MSSRIRPDRATRGGVGLESPLRFRRRGGDRGATFPCDGRGREEGLRRLEVRIRGRADPRPRNPQAGGHQTHRTGVRAHDCVHGWRAARTGVALGSARTGQARRQQGIHVPGRTDRRTRPPAPPEPRIRTGRGGEPHHFARRGSGQERAQRREDHEEVLRALPGGTQRLPEAHYRYRPVRCRGLVRIADAEPAHVHLLHPEARLPGR